MMAAGVAKPKAQGQAITKTETALISESSKGCPVSHQAARVIKAKPSTTGTKMLLTRSTRACIGALTAWASSIRRIMRDSVLCEPRAVTRITILP